MFTATMLETNSGKIFEKKRLALGKTQEQIAAEIKVTVKTIQNLEAGRTASLRLGKRMAYALALETPFDEVQALMAETAADDASSPGIDGEVSALHDIPQWDLEIAAGDWCESCINGTIDTSNAAQIRSMNQGLFRVRIRGDSMLPRFKEGEILEFKVFRHGEADDEGIKIGKPYYVHRSDGTCTFKVLESMDDETAVLRALNKRKYPKALVVPVQEIVRMARFVGKYVPDEE